MFSTLRNPERIRSSGGASGCAENGSSRRLASFAAARKVAEKGGSVRGRPHLDMIRTSVGEPGNRSASIIRTSPHRFGCAPRAPRFLLASYVPHWRAIPESDRTSWSVVLQRFRPESSPATAIPLSGRYPYHELPSRHWQRTAAAKAHLFSDVEVCIQQPGIRNLLVPSITRDLSGICTRAAETEHTRSPSMITVLPGCISHCGDRQP